MATSAPSLAASVAAGMAAAAELVSATATPATPLNPFAREWLPPASPLAALDTQAVLLSDLPAEVLTIILSHLTRVEDVGRCVAACRALWAVRRALTAALQIEVILPLQQALYARPETLPSTLLACGWLRGIRRLSLSGAFLPEEEVVSALALPNLAHLAVTGCQKVLGHTTVAAILRAERLESVCILGCWSFAGAASTSLAAACVDGTCALRTLLLGSMHIDCAELLPAACEERRNAPVSKLQVLGFLSCDLAAVRHAAAALARAPQLRLLLLSGSTLSGAAPEPPDVAASEDVDAAAPPAAELPPAEAAPPPLHAMHVPTLAVLEVTQVSPAGLLSADEDASLTVWDLLDPGTAAQLAALGARRLCARLAHGHASCATIGEEELALALASVASAPGGPRRVSPLHAAASRGDAAHAAALLALGARPDARDVTGATPLFIAAEAGHAACCAALLSAGAALDVRTTHGEGPAYIAALKGRTEATEVLLGAAAARGLPVAALANDDGWTPLHAAAVAGRAGMLALCADAAAASAQGSLDGVNRFGQTALHIAARRGDAALCGLLLAAGASAGVRDERGAAPADVAQRHGHAELAGVLRGAKGASRTADNQRRAEKRRARQARTAAVAPVG